MSVNSLVTSSRAAEAAARRAPRELRDLREGGGPGEGPGAGGGEGEGEGDTYASRVVKHIPSEVVTFYLFLVGFVAAQDNPSAGQRWGVYAIAMAGVVLYTLWAAKKSATAGGAPLSTRNLAIIIGISLVAFTAWAASMPATPFLEVTSNANFWGTIAAAAVTLLAPAITGLLGLQLADA